MILQSRDITTELVRRTLPVRVPTSGYDSARVCKRCLWVDERRLLVVEHTGIRTSSFTSRRSMSSQSPASEPQKLDFAALPLDKNGPHGNAWGRWGPNDQLGTLNFLTDDVVAKAVSECVKTGQRTSLK